MTRPVGVLLALLALLSPPLQANETDPWYAWVHPPRDGTSALNRAIGERIARALREVNRGSDADQLECREVAARVTTPMRTTAFFFFVGDLGSWDVDYTPRTSSEYRDSLAEKGAYRHVYGLMPLDPSMRAGAVLFGTDKLGHFFTNGLRQYDSYRRARAMGADEATATGKAIDEGIAEEQTWLGLYPSGIFSFADLEANHQGLLFFRALCDEGELAVVDGNWTLREPFAIERWVSPCWDEAFLPSYFARSAEAAKRGLAEMCHELDVEQARARRAHYRTLSCPSVSMRVLRDRVARGELPDPSPWSFDSVCAGPSSPASMRTAGPSDRGALSRARSLWAEDSARTPRR